MIPTWVRRWVGIPFASRGRDPGKGLDCWGLVRAVLADHWQVEVPSYDEGYHTAADSREIARLVAGELPLAWRPVEGLPKPGDVALLRVRGLACHVGIVVEAGRLLHTLPGHEAAVDRLDSPLWARRVLGYYRHEALP